MRRCYLTIVHRDPKLLRMLRDATREATRDLDNLKIVRPENSAEVAVLKQELRKSLAKGQEWVAGEAQARSREARRSSANRRSELMKMKKTAKEAATQLNRAKTRKKPTRGDS